MYGFLCSGSFGYTTVVTRVKAARKVAGKPFIAIVVLMTMTCSARAQVDQEFWFAPPEVTATHGDSPIYLRISTLDRAGTVTVMQPANKSFMPIVRTIAANATVVIDLTDHIVSLETQPADLQKTGLFISATAPVTVYYEVGSYANSEIFVLKGKNGLGNRFMIPGQNKYNNHPDYPESFSSFDIVATRDHTLVTITPSNAVPGHAKGVPFTIKLNKGETYSAVNISRSGLYNLGGSRVESNKPIAITLNEDSLHSGVCADLAGDQLVPVKVTGDEYVIMKGFLDPEEFAFVTAVYDSTQVFVGGTSSAIVMLHQGELFRFPVSERVTYLRSSRPVFVNHVTGFGCELGMAVLPALTCRGSTQISFTRSTSDFFGINIVVPKAGISNFRLNGRSDLMQASEFEPVPGTNDTWYAARFQFDNAIVPVGAASVIANSTSSFQAGTINGEAHTSCVYGYFSSFSTLFIGDDFNICPNTTELLDAGPEKDSYEWSTGETTQRIWINEPGKYWVTTKKLDCLLQDTIVVSRSEPDSANLELGPDISICPGEEIDLTLDAAWPGGSYKWNTGETTPSIQAEQVGRYSVVVETLNCVLKDTIDVSFYPSYPKPVITGPATVCPNVKDIAYRCILSDSLDYQWSIQGGQIIDQSDPSEIKVDWGLTADDAFLELKILRDISCPVDVTRFDIVINRQLQPVITNGEDTICFNDRSGKLYSAIEATGSLYTWDVVGGSIVSGQGSPNVTVNWSDTSQHALRVIESSVTDTDVCAGQSAVLPITIFRDSASLELSYVTAVHENDANSSLKAAWTIQNPERMQKDLIWLRWKHTGDPNFSDSLSLSANTVHETEFTEPKFLTTREDFQLCGVDLCGNFLTSSVHRNMVLYATSDSFNHLIHLHWNKYEGWSSGVKLYHVWAKLDTKDHVSLITTLFPGEDLEVIVPSEEALTHQYWVEAIGHKNEVSLSNLVNLNFEHPVWIPNVITPNNDGFNDRLTISNIHLYPRNKLIIYNRWGNPVYEILGFNNAWDGGDLAAGIYFYELILYERNTRYQGSLSIVN